MESKRKESKARKDFEEWQVEIVYKKQDGACSKCGKSLEFGFHRHHKNGDSSDNSIENLELYCSACHGGEAYKTLMAKKQTVLDKLEGLISMGIEGKISGAALDKLLDAMKLALTLNEQITDLRPERPPPSIRARAWLETSGALTKEYVKGLKEGVKIGASKDES